MLLSRDQLSVGMDGGIAVCKEPGKLMGELGIIRVGDAKGDAKRVTEFAVTVASWLWRNQILDLPNTASMAWADAVTATNDA
jgi:hypothetical protein